MVGGDMQSGEDIFNGLSNDIRKATLEKLALYEEIRGKDTNTAGIPFWDLIVLSALDPPQKEAYELQLKEKIDRKELPSFPTYHVINDPVGVKVGNGGGVIAVMDELEKIYHSKLDDMKVLVLLSGGYSQRLPSSSLLGKIFTCLPMGDPIYQMIELKLAMYIEFPRRMKSGIFVSSADCIELYELTGDKWDFNNPGVTSLAHPSPIEIGTTHGVYVLEEPVDDIMRDINSKKAVVSAYTGKCRRFLHKPTKEVMRSSGAVFSNNNEEFIYSDSAYFMDMPTSLLLLDWYRKRGGINCEIDAYGDFLQALGPEGTIDYCKNVKGVTMVLPDLVKTREEVFHLLRDVQLNVLMLNKSRFYHIGTTKEYIENFCQDKFFRNELAFSTQAMLKSEKSCNKTAAMESSIFIHSHIHSAEGIGRDVVIENTKLNQANYIGDNCIVSNNVFPDNITVPASSFVHTVVLRDGGDPFYITLGFGIEDNIKKCCAGIRDSKTLSYAGMLFNEVIFKFNYSHEIWPEGCPLPNLWNAKLFPGYVRPEDSLRNAVNMLTSCRSNVEYVPITRGIVSNKFYSMSDVLMLKDLKEVLEMRVRLRRQIVA